MKTAAESANQRNAVIAGFLGWTLDAFDFFVLVFVLAPVAKEFGRSIPDIALTQAMGLLAAIVLTAGAIVIGLGPEAHRAEFGRSHEGHATRRDEGLIGTISNAVRWLPLEKRGRFP